MYIIEFLNKTYPYYDLVSEKVVNYKGTVYLASIGQNTHPELPNSGRLSSVTLVSYTRSKEGALEFPSKAEAERVASDFGGRACSVFGETKAVRKEVRKWAAKPKPKRKAKAKTKNFF